MTSARQTHWRRWQKTIKSNSFANPDGNISNPTILYFPEKSKQIYIGNEGVEHYLHNLEENGFGGRLMLSIKTLLPDAKFDHTLVTGHGRFSSEDLAAKFLSVVKKMAEQRFAGKFDDLSSRTTGRFFRFGCQPSGKSGAFRRIQKGCFLTRTGGGGDGLRVNFDERRADLRR